MKKLKAYFVLFLLSFLIITPTASYSQSSLSIESFEMISNGNGVINDIVGFDFTTEPINYGAYSADWYRDVLWGGNSIFNLPNGMQAAGGWYFIVAGPNTILDHENALGRWTRNGAYDDILKNNTYEIRFTENGGKAIMRYSTGTLVDVPFEIWYVDPYTSEPDRNVRMIPWLADDDGNDIFNFKLDHQAAEDDNDPYSDWIYFVLPDDDSPGENGYNQFVQDAMNGTYEFSGQEQLARIVLMNWDRHQYETAPGAGDGPVDAMPETGTTFRLCMTKTIPVSIDIKPGSDPNSINCGNPKGIVTVAVLTTDDFDATLIDPATVTFGPAEAQEIHNKGHIEDVDGDGDQDMVFHFSLADTGIEDDYTEPTINGLTFNGILFTGSDVIRCVPNSCDIDIDDPGLHDKNNVTLLIGPDGRIAQNDEYVAQGFFPKNTCDQYIYSAGPSIGGIINGTAIVAHAPYNSEYVPSEIGNTGIPFRVFNSSIPKERKIWPPEFCDAKGNPIIFSGAENLVVQYNDIYGQQNGDQLSPLGIEIRQRSLAFNDSEIRNAIILIWEITNISGQNIDDAFFGFWCDADVGNLGNARDDRTSIVDDIAITWDSDFYEDNFTEHPSIVGFTFLETPGDLGVANYSVFVNDGGAHTDPRQDIVQYDFLSGANHYETDVVSDIRMLLSTSLSDLADGESVLVAGAVLFGKAPDGTTYLETDPDYPFRPDPSDPALADLLDTRDNVAHFYDQYIKGTGLPKRSGAEVSVSTEAVPIEYVLHQNYPNPFNPETEIRFEIPETSHVVLKIFNTLGQEIRTLINTQYEAGKHSIHWDSRDNFGKKLASGVYVYQITAGDFVKAKKMILQQ